jgi:hypothetical protein
MALAPPSNSELAANALLNEVYCYFEVRLYLDSFQFPFIPLLLPLLNEMVCKPPGSLPRAPKFVSMEILRYPVAGI